MIFDGLALAAIAVGIVAAIGVVFVAISAGQPQPAPATDAPTGTSPPPEHAAPAPPAEAQPPTQTAATVDADPALARALQDLASELHALRQQHQALERRLTLIDGMAVLLEELHATTVDAAHPAPLTPPPPTSHRHTNGRTSKPSFDATP